MLFYSRVDSAQGIRGRLSCPVLHNADTSKLGIPMLTLQCQYTHAYTCHCSVQQDAVCVPTSDMCAACQTDGTLVRAFQYSADASAIIRNTPQPPDSTATPAAGSTSKPVNMGLIVGVAVGVPVGLTMLAGLVIFWRAVSR